MKPRSFKLALHDLVVALKLARSKRKHGGAQLGRLDRLIAATQHAEHEADHYERTLETVPCRGCGGTGKVPVYACHVCSATQPKDCPVCKGVGQVERV